jgi:hypothetical protein
MKEEGRGLKDVDSDKIRFDAIAPLLRVGEGVGG